MMHVLMITGVQGVGKSTLLRFAEESGTRLAMVNCSSENGLTWRATNRETIDVVAIDHVTQDNSNGDAVKAAIDWAKQYDKPVWLVDRFACAIQTLPLDLSEPPAELNLSSTSDSMPVEVRPFHGRRFLAAAFARLKDYHNQLKPEGDLVRY